MRRGSILQLVLIGLVAGAIATAVAVFVPWLPDPATKQAERIDFVYWFATVISLFIFAVVCGDPDLRDDQLPGEARRLVGRPADSRQHDDRDHLDGHPDGPRHRDLDRQRDRARPERPRRQRTRWSSRCTAQQFAWQFIYPNGKSYPILRLPIDRGVKLEITSKDVIHSFWVPEFAQKQDAVPGQVQQSRDHAQPHSAHFPVICTELCGLGHSLMRS